MDHCDNAKVIITLLDYISLPFFFTVHNTHLRKYTRTHIHTHKEHFLR